MNRDGGFRLRRTILGGLMTPAEQFAALVETMLARNTATYGAKGSKGAQRSFGSTSLKAAGKIFAMLVNGRLIVKLPAARVDELVVQDLGKRFDPGHGRVQKEWLSVRSQSPDDWLALAIEAEAFVGDERRPSIHAGGDRRRPSSGSK